MKTFSVGVNINNNALDGKELPKKLHVLKKGANPTNDGTVYVTDETYKVFNANQLKAGREVKVPIDFDHNTEPGSAEYVKGAPKAIAGYGDPVLKDDGIWLENIEWTKEGLKHASNYKDLSPAVRLDSQGVVRGLSSVALTPTGAVRGLNFFNTQENMKNLSVPDYNKDGANAGVNQQGNNYVINDQFKAADTQDSDDCDDSYSGADSAWNSAQLTAHKDLCADLDADDHFSQYGNVDYADKENHKYPVDTEKHVRAAYSYINMPKNAAKYSPDKVSKIKSNIKRAGKKFDIDFASDKEKTKTMSATDIPHLDAYEAQPWYYKTPINKQIIMKQMTKNLSAEQMKLMAAVADMEGETDQEKVLFAFLAKILGFQDEKPEQITRDDNTQKGGLAQFDERGSVSKSRSVNDEGEKEVNRSYSAISALEEKIKTLEAQRAKDSELFSANERKQLIADAKKQGKVIPSEEFTKTLSVAQLSQLIEEAPSSVPLRTKLMNSNGDTEEAGVSIRQHINEMNLALEGKASFKGAATTTMRRNLTAKMAESAGLLRA